MTKLSFCRCGKIKGECGCNYREFETTNEKAKGIYDSKWRKLSKLYRSENPFCEECLKSGKLTGVEEVHHVIPIKVDPSQRLYWPNLMSVCRICHKEIESRGGR